MTKKGKAIDRIALNVLPVIENRSRDLRQIASQIEGRDKALAIALEKLACDIQEQATKIQEIWYNTNGKGEKDGRD